MTRIPSRGIQPAPAPHSEAGRPEVAVSARAERACCPRPALGDRNGPGTGGSWVKVRIKPTMKDKFLKAIEVDALGS